MGTVLTLPERVVLTPLLRRAKRLEAASGKRGPLIVFVLGYYRSGTTHLHYLLSADRGFVTPRWYQTLAPAGFVLSWSVTRWLLVPFLGGSRPQDDVAYGPEWPAEDDFAVNNLSATGTLIGRTVLPERWKHYRRYHTLDGLTAAELALWRWAQWSFVKRIEWSSWLARWIERAISRVDGRGSQPRVILLKTPAHTARVSELVRLFGWERVRFVHLSREAGAVVRSNVAMHSRLGPYLLADAPAKGETQERIIEEYVETERRFLADVDAMGERAEGRVSRLRYQDLIADPMAEVERVYQELGLSLTADARERMERYLSRVRDYRTAADRSSAGGKSRSADPNREFSESIDERLKWLHGAFGHDRPTRAKAVQRSNLVGAGDGSDVVGQGAASLESVLWGAVAAAMCGALWIGASWLAWDRMDWLVWPVGAIIGVATVRGMASGSRWFGVFAAVLSVAVMLVVAVPATAMTSDYRLQSALPWDHLWVSIRRGVLAKNNVVWIVLGVVSAYRLSSSKHLRTPGD